MIAVLSKEQPFNGITSVLMGIPELCAEFSFPQIKWMLLPFHDGIEQSPNLKKFWRYGTYGIGIKHNQMDT